MVFQDILDPFCVPKRRRQRIPVQQGTLFAWPELKQCHQWHLLYTNTHKGYLKRNWIVVEKGRSVLGCLVWLAGQERRQLLVLVINSCINKYGSGIENIYIWNNSNCMNYYNSRSTGSGNGLQVKKQQGTTDQAVVQASTFKWKKSPGNSARQPPPAMSTHLI